METRELTLTNRNGKRMPATLRTPRGVPKGTAIILHGLGGWKDQGVVVAQATACVDAGYQALTFDQADGANGPDGDFFHHTTTGYLHDLTDVVAHIQTESWFTGPLVLGGHSQGALTALRYAGEHPGEVERLILIAPAVSWRAALFSVSGYGLPVIAWVAAWLTGGISNWNGPNGRMLKLGRPWLFDFLTWNGNRYARGITVPVLVVASEIDKTVATNAYHSAFAQRFPRSEFHTVPGAVHDFPKHGEALAAIVRTWLTSS